MHSPEFCLRFIFTHCPTANKPRKSQLRTCLRNDLSSRHSYESDSDDSACPRHNRKWSGFEISATPKASYLTFSFIILQSKRKTNAAISTRNREVFLARHVSIRVALVHDICHPIRTMTVPLIDRRLDDAFDLSYVRHSAVKRESFVYSSIISHTDGLARSFESTDR